MEEELYIEGECEEIAIGEDEIAEIVEIDVEKTTEMAAAGKVNRNRDKRNYAAKPLEEFEELDTEDGPCPAPKINFIRKGEGRNSINMYRDKKSFEIADDLLRDIIEHTVKMYNLHRDAGVERLTISKFEAWLGIHLFLHTWRYPERKKYWGEVNTPG